MTLSWPTTFPLCGVIDACRSLMELLVVDPDCSCLAAAPERTLPLPCRRPRLAETGVVDALNMARDDDAGVRETPSTPATLLPGGAKSDCNRTLERDTGAAPLEDDAVESDAARAVVTRAVCTLCDRLARASSCNLLIACSWRAAAAMSARAKLVTSTTAVTMQATKRRYAPIVTDPSRVVLL